MYHTSKSSFSSWNEKLQSYILNELSSFVRTFFSKIPMTNLDITDSLTDYYCDMEHVRFGSPFIFIISFTSIICWLIFWFFLKKNWIPIFSIWKAFEKDIWNIIVVFAFSKAGPRANSWSFLGGNSDNLLVSSPKPFIPVDWAVPRFYLVKEALQSGKYMIKSSIGCVSLSVTLINQYWMLLLKARGCSGGMDTDECCLSGYLHLNWMLLHVSTSTSVQQPSALFLDWYMINSTCLVIAPSF